MPIPWQTPVDEYSEWQLNSSVLNNYKLQYSKFPLSGMNRILNVPTQSPSWKSIFSEINF